MESKNTQVEQETKQDEKKIKSYQVESQDPYEGLSPEEILQKKLSREHILDAYLPLHVERHWYKWWEESGFFKANPENVLSGKKKPYVMCLPPPNVTGYLHIGHGLTAAVEDSIIRRKRMQGYECLYLPGQDHAGIATHTVVEKHLKKTEGITRWDLGREKFVEKIWEWKEKHGDVIFEQLKRLGGSLDNSRFHFTMDNKLCKAVNESFVRLYEKKYIYRANRLVNWSCNLLTAISDVEVDYLEFPQPKKIQVPGHTSWYEFGVLIHFEYKLKSDPSKGLTIATTRIETMLGDTAVAVNSKDERYKEFVGQELIHPFIPDRVLKVITDDELVDMDFGTGVVKITPGHDPNDYQCGLRHGLELINIFNDDGTINENGGKYKGMKRFDCRVQIIKDLEELKLFKEKTPNPMKIGICSRSKDIIEPMLRPQWYIKSEPKWFRENYAKDEAEHKENAQKWYENLKQSTNEQLVKNIYRKQLTEKLKVELNYRTLNEEDRKKLSQAWLSQLTESQIFELYERNVPALVYTRLTPEQQEELIESRDISKLMIEKAQSKELKIIPSDFERDWNSWLVNTRDWCISRQLWWGHRIPAYLVKVKTSSKIPNSNDGKDWIVARTKEDALEKAAAKYGVSKEEIELTQDEDVLDTWYSSGLFPFSTMGWPNVEDPDFKSFFPNQILETGHDILSFWVSRMVMMSLLLTDKLPFTDVFLHPIIRDSEGRKMSKSLGNVIDPLEIIEGCKLEVLLRKIQEGNLDPKEVAKATKTMEKDYPEGFAECGSDSLRFGLLAYLFKGLFINLDVKRIIGYRQFGNKLWQTIKFGSLNIPNDFNYDDNRFEFSKLSFINQWILTKLNKAVQAVNKHFDNYDFGEATISFQTFWRNDLCDQYLEATKPIMQGTDEGLKAETRNTLCICFDYGLRLLHPMMPFLSEELYQKLIAFPKKSKSICIASYPEFRADWEDQNDQLNSNFNIISNIAAGIRQICTNINLPKNIKPETFVIITNDQKSLDLAKSENLHFCTLGRAKSLTVVSNDSEIPKGCLSTVISSSTRLYVLVKDHIKAEAECARLQKLIDQKEAEIQKNQQALDKAKQMPEDLKQQKIQKIEETKIERDLFLKTLQDIKSMI